MLMAHRCRGCCMHGDRLWYWLRAQRLQLCSRKLLHGRIATHRWLLLFPAARHAQIGGFWCMWSRHWSPRRPRALPCMCSWL